MISPPTLPIRPLPGDGETLGSYIERIAADREAPTQAVLAALGLAPTPSPLDIRSNYALLLPPALVARVAHSVRLDERRVRKMLLDVYDGTAFTMPDLATGGESAMAVFAGREWVLLRHSNLCPPCLAESGGAWQLSWRLPLVFACTKHRTLLADICPGCDMPLGSTRGDPTAPFFVRSIPTTGRCANSMPRDDGRYGRIPCSFELTKIGAVALGRSPRLLAAQQVVNAALAGESQLVGGQPLAARSYLYDVRLLTGLMLHVASVEDLGRLPRVAGEGFEKHVEERQRDAETVSQGKQRKRFVRATPQSPALMAAVIPQAVEMLARPTPAEVAESLVWVITRSRAVKGRAFARVPTAVGKSATLLPIWQEALQSLDFSLRRRSSRSRTRERPPMSEFARHVPQLLWRDTFQRYFAALTPPATGELVMRRFCSQELVRVVERCSRAAAAAALDLPSTVAGSASAIAGGLRQHGNDGLLYARLRSLAEELAAAHPDIDYAARRQMLRELDAIPWDDWCKLCEEAGATKGIPGARHRYAAVWLWEELTLSDYRQAAGLRGRPLHQRYLYTKKFVPRHLPALELPLRRYGEQLLSVTG